VCLLANHTGTQLIRGASVRRSRAGLHLSQSNEGCGASAPLAANWIDDSAADANLISRIVEYIRKLAIHIFAEGKFFVEIRPLSFGRIVVRTSVRASSFVLEQFCTC